jgi:hypothetical protein
MRTAIFCPEADEQRLDQFHGALHGATSEQKLGDKVLLGLEELSDFVHGRHHGVGN